MTVPEYNKTVNDHADGLFRFVLKNIKDEDRARDIVQDTFEKLWVKIGTVAASKVKSYLFTTAYHTFIDIIRKEKRIGRWEEADTKNMSHAEQYSDLKEVLNKGLEKLPENQKAVLLLRDYEGYSYQEIADITSLSLDQVKVYIYRARLFLKNFIGSKERVI